MTSHCTGYNQEKKESEIVIRKREEIGFKTRAKVRESRGVARNLFFWGYKTVE